MSTKSNRFCAPRFRNKATIHIIFQRGGRHQCHIVLWIKFVQFIGKFRPSHLLSIGINYAETEAGWLISPQYADNERLLELRYMWRPTNRLTLDVRGRWRDELRQRIIEDPDRDRFDFYARFTWSFTVNDFAN